MHLLRIQWLLLPALLGLTSCVVDALGNPPVRAAELDCNSVSPDVEIDIVDFAFDPSEVSVPPGSVVRWTNTGSVAHTVTSGDPDAPDAGELFDSGTLEPGATYCVGFRGTGSADYFCRPHPMRMRDARITVGDAP